MGSQHSYGITLINNRTEKEAIAYVISTDPNLIVPNSEGRKSIVKLLNLKPGDRRAFDLILVNGLRAPGKEVHISDPNSVILIEVKSTKKKLGQLPHGFFFGATENEYELAKKLGPQYKFCFVSLHPDSPGSVMLTYEELLPYIRTKRTQFQINLNPFPKS